MSMTAWDYEPISEEQAMQERYQLLPDGVYMGRVVHVEKKVSSSNNPMAELIINVFDDKGGAKQVKDYLVRTSKMEWKTIHFCDSAGLSEAYKEKKFDPDMAIDKDVMVKIRIDIGKEIPEEKLRGKPPGSKFPDKNVVEDYVVTTKGAVKYQAEHADLNDDLPF